MHTDEDILAVCNDEDTWEDAIGEDGVDGEVHSPDVYDVGWFW